MNVALLHLFFANPYIYLFHRHVSVCSAVVLTTYTSELLSEVTYHIVNLWVSYGVLQRFPLLLLNARITCHIHVYNYTGMRSRPLSGN